MAIRNIQPPNVKFELHAYGQVYDVTRSIRNWQEIEQEQERIGLSGVYLTVSFPFEFVLDAKDIIVGMFDQYGFAARAQIYIYLLGNDWKYGAPRIFDLDFVNYEEEDDFVGIPSRKTSLYDYLKTKESTKFEIPVTDIYNPSVQPYWWYERMILKNTTSVAADVFLQGEEYRNTGITVRGSMGSSKAGQDMPSTAIEIPEVTQGGPVDASTIFVKANRQTNLKIKTKVQGKMKVDFLFDPNNNMTLTFAINLMNLNAGYTANVWSNTFTHENNSIKADFEVEWEDDQLLATGQGLNLSYHIYVENGPNQSYARISEMSIRTTVELGYDFREDPVRINILEPVTVLQTLVNKITESSNTYTADIQGMGYDDQDERNKIMLCAAESIRNFTNPKIYTSYREFKEWMATLGYEPNVTENKLVFKKRDDVFDNDTTAMELPQSQTADLKIYPNKDYIYSALKIGYKKIDHENINGIFSFCGQYDYSTDVTNNVNELSIISPYSADCYGIEFLVMKRAEPTTDDKTDKNVFIVNVGRFYEENPPNFEHKTIYSTIAGNIPNQSLFNIALNPRALLVRNGSLLGICTRRLRFTGADVNSEITWTGEGMNEDVYLPPNIKLFEPVIYDVASANIQELPPDDKVNGIVNFWYKGKLYSGFIKKISRNPAWETETTWLLFKK